VNPGETKELANPDQKSYYFWDNKPTSAQYYVNNQGVSEAQACTWGNGQGDTGNRAPVNIGTSFDDLISNMGYTGLLQNKPTNPDAKLNFVIRFTGDGVSNPCSYKNGQYYNADGRGNPDGCTVCFRRQQKARASLIPYRQALRRAKRSRSYSVTTSRGSDCCLPGRFPFYRVFF
jgi:hypothetical protein